MLRINSDSQGECNSLQRLSSILHTQSFCFLLQLLCALVCRLQRGVWHDYEELFTAVTAGHVSAADVTLQQASKFAQERIASSMTICIIKVLEVVNVDHDQSQRVELARDSA